MKKFEYKIETLDRDYKEKQLIEIMDERGYELISVVMGRTHIKYYFKKEIIK